MHQNPNAVLEELEALAAQAREDIMDAAGDLLANPSATGLTEAQLHERISNALTSINVNSIFRGHMPMIDVDS